MLYGMRLKKQKKIINNDLKHNNSMKHFISFLSFFAIVLLFVGCNSKTQKTSTEIDSVKTEDTSPKDNTIYGICGEGTAMNTLQVITDNSDTLNISITDAKDNGMVLGGLECGDRLAVMARKVGKEYIASEVINLNTLLGIWIMPNPIDGSDFVGIKLKDGGIAESINNSSTFYKTWRMYDGKLVLTANRDGGGDEEETDTFSITKLGADSLCIQNSADKFEYSRSNKY